MRLKSLIQAALGVYATILLTGCSYFYMNPMTGGAQRDPPSSQEVKSAQSVSDSFASRNRNVDFSRKAPYTTDEFPTYPQSQYLWTQGLPKLTKKEDPPVSSSSPTGAPGVSAAGSAATTSPMISSPLPPAPPPASPPYRH
jgi:hypothetical protein